MTELATAEPATDAPQGEMYRTFTDQPIALIGSPTDDRRLIAEDVDLSFREFPLPFMWCEKAVPGHGDAYTVGVLESARIEGEFLLGSGYLLNTEEADKAALQNAHGVSNPSVDLAATEYTYVDDDGNDIEDSEAFWDYIEENGKLPVTKITVAKLIGCTLVSTPAFDTRLSLNEDRESRDVALVAGMEPVYQPRTYDHRMFQAPSFDGPTPLHIDADGRISGHLAVFGEIHRSVQGHQLVPRSPSNYGQFHTSPPLRLDDGTSLPVGRLTVGIGHANTAWNPGPAMAHYDNADNCFALVRAGEDKWGVWVSGVAAPWATPEIVEKGLSAPLSGDWRDFGQGLDLVAALAVNTPGFAVRGRDDEYGRQVALVASFAPVRRREQAMTAGDIAAAVSAGVTDAFRRAEQEKRDAALSATRKATLARAEKLVGKPPTVRERIGAMLAARKIV